MEVVLSLQDLRADLKDLALGEQILRLDLTARARAIYATARTFYHPIVVARIDLLLGWP
jgi:hypothetical protein